MSEITGALLQFSGHEEDSLDAPFPALAALQACLRFQDVGQLHRMAHPGGWKEPPVVAYFGGFNHLDADRFLAVFREQKWRVLEQVVLVLTMENRPSVVVRPAANC
ncbi:hypothetical protein ACFQS7_26610 [Dankookia sp. GCM10030260]|uniref:hypothetical protein n=1 Tax=Dankookia sp. GCM10030260 TaxID=3273390 RepID=UPI00360E9E5B